MEKIKNILTTNSVQGAAILIAIFSLLSQVSGLFRDRILAGTFGAGPVLDIYYAAFKIPDIMYALVAAFVSAVTIVPFLTHAIEKENWDKAHKVFSNFLNAFLIFSIPVSLLLYFFVPGLVSLYVPGFSIESRETVSMLARIMLLQPIFLGISALVSCLAQAESKFLAFSLAPIMYNLGITLGATHLYKYFGIAGLAYGVVFGAILHLIVQSFTLVKEWRHGDFLYSFVLEWREIKGLLKFSYLRAGGLFMQQVKYTVIAFFASLFGVGVLSGFQMAINLEHIFLSLIAASFATASFPTLSRLYEERDFHGFIRQVESGIKFLFFITLPIAAYCIVMRAHIVRIIYGGDALSWDATKLIALSFAIIIAVLAVQSANFYMTRVAYARRDVKSPFISQSIGILCMIVFIIFANFIFKYIFETHPGYIHFGSQVFRVSLENLSSLKALILPVALAFEIVLTTMMMFYLLYKNHTFKHFDFKNIKKSVLDSILASAILFIFVYGLLRFFEPLLGVNIAGHMTLPGLLLQAFFTSVFGLFVWYATLKWRKNEEVSILESHLKNRIWNKRVEAVNDIHDIHQG